MLGTYFTFTELLLWIPLVTGLITFFIKDSKNVKTFAILSSLATLIVSIISLTYSDLANHPEYGIFHNVSYVWMPYIGSSFSVGMDGIGFLLTFLTSFSYPLIFAATWKSEYKNAHSFYGLMLLSQAGIMGVFVAYDALLFYFFWELALIPIYFLCSKWGEEKRIQATFKFFVYTFLGSLLMLVGIMYVYQHTPAVSVDSAHSFALRSFYSADLNVGEQKWLFWLFFAAFAVKIPIFPFHTWQPGVYEQGNYPSVMVLSAIMVKMGVFGMIRWLIPIFPAATASFADLIIILSIIVLEMFNHGVNILALWIIVDIIEKKTGVRKIQELRGLAVKAPSLAIFLVIIAFANIGLPLTNSFISEFLMFNGLFQYNKILVARLFFHYR